MGTRSPPCVARFLRADCSKCDSALRNVCRELDIVERAGVDRLQRTVLRQLRRPVVVEPLVDLLAPTPLSERLLGCLRRAGAARGAGGRSASSRTPAAVPSAWNRASRRWPAGACTGSRGRTWPPRWRAAGRSAASARRCPIRTLADRCRAGTARAAGARGGRSRVPIGRCRRIERHGGWCGVGGAVGHGAPSVRPTQSCQSTAVKTEYCHHDIRAAKMADGGPMSESPKRSTEQALHLDAPRPSGGPDAGAHSRCRDHPARRSTRRRGDHARHRRGSRGVRAHGVPPLPRSRRPARGVDPTVAATRRWQAVVRSRAASTTSLPPAVA